MSSTASNLLSALPATSYARAIAAPEAVVVDMRSPGEFAEDHAPGAHNVPLFDDVDRALIGLLYKRSSPDRAFAEGREVVLRRIDGLVERIAVLAGWERKSGDLATLVRTMTDGGIGRLERELTTFDPGPLSERPVIVHCWRGGLRSRAMVALLRSLGLDRAYLLEGGYKSYRRHVVQSIDAWQAPPAFVIRGLTGVGKTLVLRALERLRPRWTLDLEGLAGHRSSLLGGVGLSPVTQKTFESRMAARISEGFPGPAVFEGESRKVGDRIIPASVWSAMAGATNIELTASRERRVRVLIDDYLGDDYLGEAANGPALRERLEALERRAEEKLPLLALFDAGRIEELVELLLDRWYDPLYLHSEKGNEYAVSIDADDEGRAAAEIAEWIERRPDS